MKIIAALCFSAALATGYAPQPQIVKPVASKKLTWVIAPVEVDRRCTTSERRSCGEACATSNLQIVSCGVATDAGTKKLTLTCECGNLNLYTSNRPRL